MSKADIQDAFRLIPINKSDYTLLCFHWGGKFFHDAALPMRASSSCQLFESFSSPIQWGLNVKFKIYGISHLLDDSFFVGKAGTAECLTALHTFLALADNLGIPIKSEKTVYPTTCLTIIGIEIDSKAMVARLPGDTMDKIASYRMQSDWLK